MKDEWTDAYSIILPMLGLAVAVAGLSLSLLQTWHYQATLDGVDVEVPRVRYSGDDIFVEARDPGEWRRMQDFVQPGNLYPGAFYG